MLDLMIKAALAQNGIVLPGSEYSLEGVSPEGRFDVVASNRIARMASDHPVTEALFKTVRPFIDGYLVSQLGPSRVRELVNGIQTKGKSKKQKGLVRYKTLQGQSPRKQR